MGTEAIQAKHGIFIAREKDMITKMLRLYGEWAEESVQLIKSLVKQGDSIVDVGANIGTLTIPFAKHVGESGSVYAIEGQIENFYNLCANLVLNDLCTVRAFHCLAGDKRAETSVVYPKHLQGENHGNYNFCKHINTPFKLKSGSDRIAIEKLDHILSHIGQLNLVKIDVEGSELQVLNGMLGLINKHKPYLYCECASEVSYEKIMPLLKSIDYSCYWHPTFHYRNQNFFGSKNLTPGYGDLNLLGIPRDKAKESIKQIKHLECVNSWEEVTTLFPDLIF